MGSNLASLDRSQKVCSPSSVLSFLAKPIGILTSGLAQTAVHKADPFIQPSYSATSAATGSGALSSFMSTLSLAAPGGNQGLLPEKRPTFAFHRRIRDDPVYHVELPSESRHRYPTAVKPVSGAIQNLVQEWTAEWLAGTRSDADAEVRLRGMLEEVIWGNVIWYGVGGWATRGDSGRAMEADFFLCVASLILPKTISADFLVPILNGCQKKEHILSPQPSSYPVSFSRTKAHRRPLRSNPAHSHSPIASCCSKII